MPTAPLYWYFSRFHILYEQNFYRAAFSPPIIGGRRQNSHPPTRPNREHEYRVSLFVPLLCYLVYHFAISNSTAFCYYRLRRTLSTTLSTDVVGPNTCAGGVGSRLSLWRAIYAQ